jgi:hypothetical protein
VKLITVSIFSLENAGYKVRHTYPPMRFHIEGLGENLVEDELHELADKHGMGWFFLPTAGYSVINCS